MTERQQWTDNKTPFLLFPLQIKLSSFFIQESWQNHRNQSYWQTWQTPFSWQGKQSAGPRGVEWSRAESRAARGRERGREREGEAEKKRHSWRLLTLWPLPGLGPCYWNNGNLKKRGPLIKQQISKHSYLAERKKTGLAISLFIVLLNGIVYSAGTKAQLILHAENTKCTQTIHKAL